MADRSSLPCTPSRGDFRIAGEDGGPSKNAFPCGTLSCKHIGAPGEPDHFVASCERLLDDPEKHLRGLCSYLSMRYEAYMVSNYAEVTEKIVAKGENWKDKSREPPEDLGLKKDLETFDEAEMRRIEEQLDWPEFHWMRGCSEPAPGRGRYD